MNSLLRSTMRLPRPSSPSFTSISPSFRPTAHRPYATQSYGGEDMSGHPKSDGPNPKVHLEHPGPESPASVKSPHSSSSSSPPAQSHSKSDTPAESASTPSSTSTSTLRGGSPAISNPRAPSEDANEEVRKHNEDVVRRRGGEADGKGR